MSIHFKNSDTPFSSPYRPPKMGVHKAQRVATQALASSATPRSVQKPLQKRRFHVRRHASAPSSLKKQSPHKQPQTPVSSQQASKESIPTVDFPDLGTPKPLPVAALLPPGPSTPVSQPKARRAKRRALKILKPETPIPAGTSGPQAGLTLMSTPAKVRAMATKHPALAPETPVPTASVSPKVKLGVWRVRRTPKGTIHATPPKELKPAMRKVTHALYSIERLSPGGTVKTTYGGSVARSHPDVKSKNNVLRRFQTYNRELNNPKKRRPVITEMRKFSDEFFVTVYRSVGGDINALHQQEARHIRHVKRKHPLAKNLNVSDPKKEPDLTGPRPQLRGRRRKRKMKK